MARRNGSGVFVVPPCSEGRRVVSLHQSFSKEHAMNILYLIVSLICGGATAETAPAR